MTVPVQRDLIVEAAFGADPGGDPMDWSWTDVSADLLAQTINIKRGRDDEASLAQPMSVGLQLDNVSGNYTPDNPMGAHYPYVRRGTPLRLSVAGAETYFIAGDPATAYVTTPDAAALDITGDIDIRMEVSVGDPSASLDLIGKWADPSQRSWKLSLTDNASPVFDKTLRLQWTTDGTTTLQRFSTEPLPLGQRVALRVTLDVNNGAAGHTVTFYTGPSIDGPWQLLGDPVITAGTTSIFNSTSALIVGENSGSTFGTVEGKIWVAQVYIGIGGTLAADADFRDLDVAATGFVDSAGRSWTLGGDAELGDLSVRFIGQVDSWAPTWPQGDVTGDEPPDSRCDLVASSVRRRMLQGASQTGSTLRSTILAGDFGLTTNLLAYWPLEDGVSATEFGAATTGTAAMGFLGAPQPGAYADYPASEALPTFTAAGAQAAVPTHVDTGEWTVSAVVVMPDTGTADEATILDIRTSGSAARYVVRYDAGTGFLRLQVFSSAAVPVELANVTANVAVNGKPCLVYVEGFQSGTAAGYTLGVAPIDTSYTVVPSATAPSGTAALNTAGQVVSVGIGTDLNLTDDVVVGHVFVADQIQVFFFSDTLRALIAWAGESALDRFLRLCNNAGVDGVVVGGEGLDSTLMGVQLPQAVTDALNQCEASDGGILLDQRETVGLLFRPRDTLYRQAPALILDASASEIANPFEPTLDDQGIRNDITVQRAGGASSRVVDQASVDAEGLYDETVELSLFTDAQAADQASWRLNLGTVAGMRYATVTVDFDTATPELLAEWLSGRVDVGDLIRIENLPRQHPPNDLDLIVQGYTETISPSRYLITFNCSPALPYNVAVYDGTGTEVSRYSSDGTVTNEALDTTETSIDIDTPSGPVWTTDPAEYPFDINIGGERITAGGCTGTGATQTFTSCTRSVNGVVKSHAAGTAVDLWEPSFYAL